MSGTVEKTTPVVMASPVEAPPTFRNDRYPRGHFARGLCLTILALSWIGGIFAIVYGAIHRESAFEGSGVGWFTVSLNRNLKEVVPLFLNIIVTLLEVGLGLIHTTALRWALKDRLTFHSNLRLFSRVPGSWSLGRISNFLNAGFLILAYCSTGLVFSTLPVPDACKNVNDLSINIDCSHPQTYVSPQALIALGVGIVGQAALSTCQLFAAKIPTWSGNSINVAWALRVEGHRQKRPGRCLMGVDQTTALGHAQYPKQQQVRAFSSHKEVRRVVRYLWVVVILCFAWFGLIFGLIEAQIKSSNIVTGAYKTSDWFFIPDTGGTTSILQADTVDTQGSSWFDEPIGALDTVFVLTLALMMAIQAFITMALHCAELIVNLSRDEDQWRSMATTRGYRDTNIIVSVATSWKALLLLASKPFLHWVFGMALQFYYAWGLFFRPPQILYLAILLLVFAAFPTTLALRRPKGPQPANYGHLQSLVDNIDVYAEKLWWGDMTAAGHGSAVEFYGDGLNGMDHTVRHAGTRGEVLPQLRMGVLYA